MKRIKVATVVGTRPEIIRLSRVMAYLDRHTDHVLIHTGQSYDYELNQVFFDELGIRPPDHYLDAAGETPAITVGNVISKVDPVLAATRPDALLVLGDTNSCLAVIAAKRRKIPIFHMEAGNRCFDERVPEEANRRLVDHLSDVNLPYSERARENLMREGIPTDRIIKTGSPMFEVLRHYRPGIESSQVLERLKLTARDYFVVSFHREENVEPEESLTRFVAILNALAERYRKKVIVSTHPRTRRRLDEIEARLDAAVELQKPLGFLDFVHLQQHAYAVLSDSGTITEESSILGFPAVNLREAHERPEGMEEAAVMMVGLSVERVLQALDVLLDDAWRRPTRLPRDYDVPNVGDKVLRIILSHTDYVNRRVWRK